LTVKKKSVSGGRKNKNGHVYCCADVIQQNTGRSFYKKDLMTLKDSQKPRPRLGNTQKNHNMPGFDENQPRVHSMGSYIETP